ncbi:probable JmjC domain-containing histone demethylation protein 2C isoform X3 [Diachasma alloeum]|uniref:probable JmjC domain-containing histone demethylation protein 2C isoform X3 n=1 Tax=Diachasma alloeum TaxID=454923 RepID=UPI0007383149|nr:probable JmjC domain-containing histone demethylation protein 2C isoform X3 [Diachasma alloeum]
MAYKFREEIVGKRFLSVSGFSKLKVNKISEWGWRAGVIRAASHRDNNCPDLQVLVEYDDVEWQRREWLSPHRDTVFSFFLIEKGLCWSERPDQRPNTIIIDQHYNHTNNNHQHRLNGKSIRSTTTNSSTVAWPAISFYSLVSRAQLDEDMMPVEFMHDRRLEFVDYSKLRPFTQDWELTKSSVPWANAVRRWAEMQDGQRILLTTPSVLVGFRVEVYRAEGTTQWYTAVIVGYNESTKDLTVTDDTVLEDHNEDPGLVQMRLIGDGVVESIMRGEVVGMTPRRSRSSTGLMTHAIVVPRVGRRPRGRPGNVALPGAQALVPPQIEKEKVTSRNNNRRGRVSEGTVRDKVEELSKEDRENKGPTTGKPGNRTPRPVLEETNNASGSAGKLRKRPTGIKSNESNSRRSVRSRRTPVKFETDRTDDGDHIGVKDKEERLDTRTSEEEEIDEEGLEEDIEENEHYQEPTDPLVKRLKTSTRKLRSDSKESNESKQVAGEPLNKEENEDKIVDVRHSSVEAEEDSESRERDREPEPPPAETPDTGGNLVIDVEPKDEIHLNGEIGESIGESTSPDQSEDPSEAEGSNSQQVIKEKCKGVEKSEVELNESGKQDGSVLDRLSPVNGVPGRHSLLHEEQERNRHNESPVILAERLNKPPPSSNVSAHHYPQHHLQQYHPGRYTTGSPVIHHHRASPHNQHILTSGLIDVSDKGSSQSLNSSRIGDDAGSHLMEVEAGAIGVPGGPCGVIGITPITGRSGAYGDSGSDSGISSLRSAGSGDERSGSRSSALSAEDTAVPLTVVNSALPARIWHVHSVQHTSLMMAHPSSGTAGGGASSTGQTVTAPPSTTPLGYQSPAGHHHPAAAAEMLWRPPRYPSLSHSLLAPGQPTPEELLERDRHERMLRERREAEVRELEKREREREAKMERERLEKQRAAEQAVHKHFEESLRLAQQKVSYAPQRNMQSASMAWNSFIPLPPPGSRSHPSAPPPHSALTGHSGHHHPGGATSHSVTVAQQQQQREREERDARERERDAQAREREREHLAAAERLHRQAEARDHAVAQQRAAYYAATAPSTAQQVLRPSSVPSKVDYPPPPAHSRASKASLPVTSHHDKPQVVGPPPLPKAEPNVSLFNYSAYQAQPTYIHELKSKNDLQHKTLSGKPLAHDRDHHGRELLPNPPPLLPDHKSSVIVKNEGREHQKVPPPHSSSPKMMSYLNVQQVGPPQSQQHKGVTYEYRSPTQSPHHLHHLDNLQSKGLPSHHRQPQTGPTLPPSPHQSHPHNRQSPHGHPHQTPHPSPPEARYLSRPETGLPYAPPKSTYSYPHPPNASPTSHYPPNPGSKPKVSSPAPPHIYGKPNSGIMTGTPVCRAEPVVTATPLPLTSKAGSSPYQQVPHHHGAPHLPPPAHSRGTVYDSRFSTSLPSSKLPPLHSSPPAASAPRPVVTHPHHMTPVQPIHQAPVNTMHTNFQTQPLDLGVERSSSPKRKAPTPGDDCGQPVALECKKRRTEEPQQPWSLESVKPIILARVHELMPLIAKAATARMTDGSTASVPQSNNQEQTVVSVSPAPRTASGDGSVRPASAGSVGSLNPTSSATPSAAPSPAPAPSPVPQDPSPAPSAASAPGTPAKGCNPTNTDSEKSNSPAPRPPSRTNYPVHKLKKAWLQRHSGEDATEDNTGVVGSGSCVTLPLNIAQAPSQPLNSKEREGTTTSLTSAVNSIHNIGSMAVNSINKSKVAGKSGRKGGNKEINGHGNDGKGLQEDSSSSDPERKSPPKRKPPKVKRKKGAGRRQQTPVDEQRRRKEDKQVSGGGAGSDSSNESEAGSASDESETIQPTSKRHTTTNSNNSSENGSNKEPRKRGRRPKSSKGNDTGGEDQQPRQKKERRDESTGSGGDGQDGDKTDPFYKPSILELKRTGDSWLQDNSCFTVAPRLVKCRECRMTPNQRLKTQLPKNIFCRFYAFRRLRYIKSQLAIAGYSDPHKDASEDDLRLWLPGNHEPSANSKDEKSEKNEDEKPADKQPLDLEMACRLLRQVGDQFCDLLHQEKNALQEHMAEDGTVAWKRVIQGVRELCDVCETTLFNYHWTCGRCGFVVCIDCYKGRKDGTIKIWGEGGKGRDDFSWLLCTNRQVHEPERLMLTQMIAGDSLTKIGHMLHEARAEWGIPQHCSCSIAKSTTAQLNDTLRSLVKGETVTLNGSIKQEMKDDKRNQNDSNGGSDAKTNGEDKNSPLNWLADVALQNQDKNDSGSSSDSDEDRDGNYSTLRELLIRPSHKPNGSGSRSNSPTNSPGNTNQTGNTSQNSTIKAGKKSKMDTLDEVISSVIEHSVKKEKDSIDNDDKPRELKHFVRRYKWTQHGREPLPIRIMTLTESKSLYPDVPHSWLCDGKLLKLNDPHNINNYRIFQDQWKRGQPVIVSDVAKSLDMELWHPDAFARDFGDEKNDLVNCMNGNLVPNQPMKKFWEGFENFSKRLKDDKGNPMLLKLKDWPPGDDFAELLPSRFADLMKVLPLSEYTHRDGRLNLASRLPCCFIRPDLGPKMYNAYGSAVYSNKGTTNLHLDISDAVNVMVYVGIPQDSDKEQHIAEALRAIDEAGCDVLTKRRVRERGEAPGALWHIYAARDADKIRDLLNAVAIERGARLEPHHDPIHDQSFYLDGKLRKRLYEQYGVEGYAVVQCLGDAVFVPAGAPHQVRNLHNCIKVAEDFVSPENVSHCFHLTQEFRALSDTHTNHEDKLQIKNIIYHTVKDALTVLANAKEEAISKLKGKVEVKEET